MKIIKQIHNNLLLLFILGTILLLRLPSLWEPNWYGDEGIYLILGQMMQRGAILYRDIWDNKPPLLYVIYAPHPTLLWAKISATIFVIGTCIGMYKLFSTITSHSGERSDSRISNVFADKMLRLVATASVGTLLSLPLLEGTIANAELYFTFPIVWGAYLIYNHFVQVPAQDDKRTKLSLFIGGFLAGVSFLIKVPALFDFFGMILAASLILFEAQLRTAHHKLESSILLVRKALPFAIGLIFPIALTILYFFLNNALKDFLIASFFQNASYVAIDSGPFSKLTNPLFTKAAILVASCLLLVVGYFKKFISKEILFLSLWLGFSLYGALLSNRPYVHYLLQIVPPAVLLGVYLFSSFWQTIRRLAESESRISLVHLRDPGVAALPRMTILGIAIAFVVILFNIESTFHRAFRLPTVKYYQNWFDYVSERKSWEDYVSFFDRRTLDSYRLAEFIKRRTQPNDPIFIWADAANAYVLSERPAATRFIQAHHLTTIDPINYQNIISRLEELKPKLILVSRPVKFPFPKLEDLLEQNYEKIAVFNNMYIYESILSTSSSSL